MHAVDTQVPSGHWQVAYDIADPRRLRRVEKALSSVGLRLHFSLFVCELRHDELTLLQRRLARLIDSQADSVRYTPLCPRDRVRTRHLGTSAEPLVPAFWVA